jgi:hypothetical protein
VRRLDSTSSPATRDTDPGTREPSHSSHAADRRGWPAALAATGLVISLLTPWYDERVSARGLRASHELVEELSGAQALSAASLTCVLVAIALAALALVRLRTPVNGLGAQARRIARARIDGALVAAGGLGCVVMILSTIVAPPTVATTAGVAAAATTGVRWGVLLSLLFAAGLTLAGVRMLGVSTRSARREHAVDRRPTVPREPEHERDLGAQPLRRTSRRRDGTSTRIPR